jgi:dipeptidyl aminopeptidase/acylaminoacyl peptidase
MFKKLLLFVFIIVATTTLYSSNKMVISNWLTTPPHQAYMPVFHDISNTSGKKFEASHLLGFEHISFNNHFPGAGEKLAAINGVDLVWKPAFTDANGYITIGNGAAGENPQIAYLAAYIRADRYIHTTLELKSPYLFRVWVDGEIAGTKSTADTIENSNRVSKELKLERGNHLIVIKLVRPAVAPLEWKLTANLEIKPPFSPADISFSLNAENNKNIKHVLDGVKTTDMQLSADGKLYSVTYRRSLPPSDQSESWTEIRRVADKKLVHSFRNARITQLQWLPQSNKVSYVMAREKKSTLYLHDFTQETVSVVLEDIENFSGYKWAPNEQFVIYTRSEEGTGTTADMRQVLGMQDRQPTFRNRSFLFHYDIATRVHNRLTHGNQTTTLHDISPDSRHIIFCHNTPNYTSRSFSSQSIYMLNLQNMKLETLWTSEERSVRVRFSPDGKFLLATGGPSAFKGAGENVAEGSIPNNYDTQAYLYSFQTGKIDAFTRDFNPSVSSVYWSALDNNIYLLTTDEDYQRLYRYDLKKQNFSRVELGFDFVSGVNFADKAPIAVFKGSQTNAFPKHYLLNLRNMKFSVLDEAEADTYRHVTFGEVKDWNFKATSGADIKGRVYLPPGFDPGHKYPVIVYYYGGTTPVGRSFAGRYPFNLWAGHGYIVYVLQPSGAIGFGQQFSAAHVNNWGLTVADEIIEGTKKFLQAHPFADPSKVGCAGASYGGFMTMLLMTRTDIFAAAISHAGISSISSYWGEGYWGYSYSSEASAQSFPWNNQELYVGQSPLFHADKVNTPLLLISGDSDTNVPPGESIQMYTALKILDRPVELILVKGEDHHIVTYGKRIKWHNTIMAWWDKHLKDQSQWWDEQYPATHYQ